MAARYAALLTDRQADLLIYLDDTIQRIPELTRQYNSVLVEFDERPVSKESIYASLRWLEARGLAMRNPGWKWPHEWTATEDGQLALDAAESTPALRPTRRLAA